MEHIKYISSEKSIHIDNQHDTKEKVKEIKALFMSEDVTLEQLAEIVYNSYLRKHPEEAGNIINLNENNPQLNKAA